MNRSDVTNRSHLLPLPLQSIPPHLAFPHGRHYTVNTGMRVSQVSRKIVIIALAGDVSSAMEQELNEILSTALPTGKSTAILDFQAARSLDNTALSMLVRAHNSARHKGQQIIAARLSGRLLDIFRLARLNEGIPCYDDIPTALQHAGYGGQPPPDAIKLIQDTTPAAARDLDDAWARPVSRLEVKAMPDEAVSLNVKGRRVAGPLQGFGRLWQKTYSISLPGRGLDPARAVAILKENFTSFQPPANRFYPPPDGIRPGGVILINADTPGGPVVTGVMVLYAGRNSFTFITPEGHPEAGWVTFSSFREQDATVVQIEGLARAGDPVYELAFRILGSKLQQDIWKHVLQSMLNHLGGSGQVQVTPVCLDNRLQWPRFFNLFLNAQILTLLYMPVLLCRRLFKR